MFDKTYYATHPDMMECVSNDELRDRYLIGGLFRDGECVLNYTHAERFVIGGVAVVDAPVALLIAGDAIGGDTCAGDGLLGHAALGVDVEPLVEGVVPHVLHVLPVANNAIVQRVRDLQHAPAA